MKNTQPKHVRVLAIAPSTRGFGFAVFDGDALVDWGQKVVKGDKNGLCIPKVEKLIIDYEPDVLVIEDFARTKRGPRIRLLIQEIIDLAPKHNVGVKLFSRQEVYQVFFVDGEGTKDSLAAILAKRFPDELGIELPPKRETWESEDPKMAIFDAMAWGLMVG
jgi:hypothetical protein